MNDRQNSNLPKNEDPRPTTESIVTSSPAKDSAGKVTLTDPLISSPYNTTKGNVPPPMPKIPAFPTLAPDIDSMARMAITSYLKDRVTVNNQPGVMENGRINFSVPIGSTGERMGPSLSSLQSDHRSDRWNGPEGSNESKADENNRSRLEKADFHGSVSKNFEARRDQEKKDDLAREARLDLNRPLEQHTPGGGNFAHAISDLNKTERLQGETGKDYEERRKASREISKIKDPVERSKAMNSYAEKAMADVHLDLLQPNSYVPLCITRADGRTKSLVYIQSAVTVDATNGVTRDVGDYFDGYTHPFKVVLKKLGNQLSAGVVYYSHLFKSLRPGDTQTITGLLSRASDVGTDPNTQGTQNSAPPPPPPPSTGGGVDQPATPTLQGNGIEGWVSANDGDYVYLEISISNGSVTSANIKCDSDFDGTANAWDTGSYVEKDSSNPPKQTKARIALAKIVGGFPEQYVTTNLVMTDCVIDGQLASYPVPC